MAKDSKTTIIAKGSWRMSAKCDFSQEPPAWKYFHQGGNDDWTCHAKPKPLPLKKRAVLILNKIKQAQNTIKTKLTKQNKKNNEYKWMDNVIESNHKLHWLSDHQGMKELAFTKAESILFNHIVRSKSTQSLTALMSVVDKHQTVELRGLAMNQPCWFYIKEKQPIWQVFASDLCLANPDIFFIDANTPQDDDAMSAILGAHRQTSKLSVIKYIFEQNSCIIQFDLSYEICRYLRGSFCGCLPIPGEPIERSENDPKEPVGVYSPEIVISSENVQQSLLGLNDIWQDRASAILVSGPPGSGKENYALSIPYGSGRTVDKIPKIAFKQDIGAQQDLERQLFGYRQDDGSTEDGLIAKASKSAIFIDEAHYPVDSEGVRASLLRALEAREYYPVGAIELKKVDDVQWIFASSLPLQGRDWSIARVPPPDFWTRMTHSIRIHHPLDYEELAKQTQDPQGHQINIIINLFKFIWWDNVRSHFGINPVTVLAAVDGDPLLTERDAAEQLAWGYISALLNEDGLNALAIRFAENLITIVDPQNLSDVSIRGIRIIVSRIFSNCVGSASAGIKDWAGEKCMANEKIGQIIKEHLQIAKLGKND